MLTGKSRVAPVRYVSIPKLELTAAAISVTVSKVLHKELNAVLTQDMEEFYWTDSQVVLGYLKIVSSDSRYLSQIVCNFSGITQILTSGIT